MTLWFTEGIRRPTPPSPPDSRGRAARRLELARNERHGGKAVLPDFEHDRVQRPQVVYSASTRDACENSRRPPRAEPVAGVAQAARRRLRFIYLPSRNGGAKIGLDDFLAAGHTRDDVLALATEWRVHRRASAAATAEPVRCPTTSTAPSCSPTSARSSRRFMVLPSDEVADLLALWVAAHLGVRRSVRDAVPADHLGGRRQRQDAAAGDPRRALPARLARGQPVDGGAVPQDRPADADAAARRDGQLSGRRPPGRAVGPERRLQARRDRRPLQGQRRARGVQVLLPEGVRRARSEVARVHAAVAQSITIRLERKTAGERVEMWIAPLCEPEAEPLRERCEAWAHHNVERARAAPAGAAGGAGQPRRRGLVGAAGDRRPGRRRLAGAGAGGGAGCSSTGGDRSTTRPTRCGCWPTSATRSAIARRSSPGSARRS